MQTEEHFIRYFWNNVFNELNMHNRTMPDVAETPDNFISRLDEIAVAKQVSSFGFNEHHGGALGDIRAKMTVDYGAGKKFQIDINADIRFDKNTKIRIVYVELSKLHQNNKEFLTNMFFQNLPYAELEMLLDSLKDCNEKFDSALMEFRKKQKMTQLLIATIKSLLSEKFKNTNYDWKITDFGDDYDVSFVILLLEDKTEVSRLIVDKSNLVQKITEWEL